MKICNRCGYQNTDDSKKCANCLVDLHWAKVNLGKFMGALDDTKRIGEEERKRRGIEDKEPTEQTHNMNKAGELAKGFFGWFLIGNLVFLLELFSSLYFFDSEWIMLGVPVVTVIVIGIQFFMKRNWLAYGIVAAVITNPLVMLLIGLSTVWKWSGAGDLLMMGLVIPLPLGILLIFQS